MSPVNSRLSTEFGMMVFFKNLGLMEFQVRSLALFFPSLVTAGFEWFRMGSFHKNIQLMLEFPKGPFLILINDLPDDAIFNIAIYADDTISSVF